MDLSAYPQKALRMLWYQRGSARQNLPHLLSGLSQLNDMVIRRTSTHSGAHSFWGPLNIVVCGTLSNCTAGLWGFVSGRHAGAGRFALGSITDVHLRLNQDGLCTSAGPCKAQWALPWVERCMLLLLKQQECRAWQALLCLSACCRTCLRQFG